MDVIALCLSRLLWAAPPPTESREVLFLPQPKTTELVQRTVMAATEDDSRLTLMRE